MNQAEGVRVDRKGGSGKRGRSSLGQAVGNVLRRRFFLDSVYQIEAGKEAGNGSPVRSAEGLGCLG